MTVDTMVSEQQQSAQTRGALYVGTSGFAYKEWKGVFYPKGVTDKQMLAHYSGVLPSVEINYTFRRLPSESTLLAWKEQSKEGFKLSLKASQRITHFKRLKEVQDDVDEFVRRAKTLEDRLGAILFQCPPNLEYDRVRFEAFLATLPPVCKYACEFRHASWNTDEVKELLAKADVALCGAETDETSLGEAPLTAGHVYLRLRKEEYAPDEISAWAGKIRPILQRGTNVYCYFKHEGGGAGPEFAQALKGAVG